MTTSFDAMSPTVVSVPRPSATTRIAMSRSVITPTSLPPSTIGSEPTSSDFMICAASATVFVGPTVVGFDVIAS